MKILHLVSCLVLSTSPFAARAAGVIHSPEMQLPVIELRKNFAPYVSYCQRHLNHCNLSGPQIIEFNSDTGRLLQSVNTNANIAVRIATDSDLYGREEYWEFPAHGAGDCEDIALYKRERLVAFGLPRAAMTIAIVHYQKEMFPHAVLLVETSEGTFLLDSLENDVGLWHDAPYNFEARERPDGTWARFDQSIWTYE